MENFRFEGENGDFVLKRAQNAAGAYLPLINEAGMISSITPLLAGDCKTGQNTFLLEPASEQTLIENRATRNFWIMPKNGEAWSVCGQSSVQEARRFTDDEDCTLDAGLMWQRVSRTCRSTGLHAEVLSFVPTEDVRAEIMKVTLKNISEADISFKCAAAVPLYGRSADNIRDHRHVTSLLQRVKAEHYGITLKPALTFDERGHRPGSVTYRVWAEGGEGEAPEYMVPDTQEYIGCGSFDWPQAVVKPETVRKRCTEGDTSEGGEVTAALFFAGTLLKAGQEKSYRVVMTIDDDPSMYLTDEGTDSAFEHMKMYWQKQTEERFCIYGRDFTSWMKWVSAQPLMRRICGCSFLPHHDYGRGGRGWRDLWQDSLALLMNDPASVRDSLINYFAGVRPDGTNATIIGTKPGEFKADRNNIPRVWMDHGFWPLLTSKLYIDETGDESFLWEEQRYFDDDFAIRGEWERQSGPHKTYKGSVFEHLLTESITAFFDVGEHGNIRLRGADWNDALDMAAQRGESVAFTAAYAYSITELGGMLRHAASKGRTNISLSAPLISLIMSDTSCYGIPEDMTCALKKYCGDSYADISKVPADAEKLAERLEYMGRWIREHISKNEWTGDDNGNGWFNSYYDNSGCQADGMHEGNARMMLTGQVFTMLSGTASKEQETKVIRAADRYLFDPERGGYCLNTDFKEVKTDLGRMFGFAYGSKENGAVFCHMAVMYAYALYVRGYVMEGKKALECLYRHSVDSDRSGIFPGIPEYFDMSGKGMYPYLTGAASWLIMTLRTQVFGVRGRSGEMVIEPKLTADQFDGEGNASIRCRFGGRVCNVEYHNRKHLDWGEYRIGSTVINGVRSYCGSRVLLPSADMLYSGENDDISISIELEPDSGKD